MKKLSVIHREKKCIFLISVFIFFTTNILFSQWAAIGSVSGLGNWPSVFDYDQNTIFIVGGSTGPVIWRSTNGGVNFTQLPTNGLPVAGSNRFLTCVCATGVNTIFVGDGSNTGNGLVKNAKVYMTTNGGTNWSTILSTGTNVYGFINGIVFSRTNPLIGFANSDPNSDAEKFKHWKTTNGGANWVMYEADAPNSSGAQNSVFLIDENFCGFGLNTATARVAITTNGGANFSFYNIAGYGGDNGFVSTVAFSNDKLNGMAATSQTSTAIARTTNGGLNWFSQTIPCTITGHCNIKWVPGTPVVYLVVSSSSQTECYKSINNGDSWSLYTFPSGASNITHTDLLYLNITMSENEAYIFATNKAGNLYGLHEFPMPVKIFSFTNFVSARNNTLKWVTSEEINNKGFEIYRTSDENNHWLKIGFVSGKGTSYSPTFYEFPDNNLNTGKYFYRLKQIDYNGNFEYFNLGTAVSIANPDKYNLSQNYPNPFNPSTVISYSIPEAGFVTLKIYNIAGKEITTLVNESKNSGFHDVKFENNKLTSGVYFYKISINKFTLTKSMLVVK